MATANPLWGAPRVHGELLKLGLDVSESTVSRYMPRTRKPPSQTWRSFLDNHIGELISIDLFTVPTNRFQVLLFGHGPSPCTVDSSSVGWRPFLGKPPRGPCFEIAMLCQAGCGPRSSCIFAARASG